MGGMIREISLGGIYFQPLLIIATVGLILTYCLACWLNRRRWSRFVFYPPGVFVALMLIFTILIELIIFQIS